MNMTVSKYGEVVGLAAQPYAGVLVTLRYFENSETKYLKFVGRDTDPPRIGDKITVNFVP